MAQSVQQRLDSFFRQGFRQGQFQGSVLIAAQDTVLYQQSFGVADESTGRLLNDSSVYELASVSKQFTAMAILLLEEKGKLKLTDSLRHFFPELPYPGVTVQHLVYHTGGLPDYLLLVKDNTPRGITVNNQDLIRLLARLQVKAVFPPGEKWEYSNTGYALLAAIVEKVSGQSYGDFLQDQVFRPLGMKHTQVYRRRYEKRTVENYAYGYVRDSAGRFILPDEHPNFSDMVVRLDGIVGDGTVNSTTGDLFRWSRALDKHLLLPAHRMQQLYTPGRLNNGEETSYAFGWLTDHLTGIGRIVNHGGGWPGYGSLIQKHLDDGKLIILLSNHDQPTLPLEQVPDLIYGKIPLPTGTITIPPGQLAEYAGTYQIFPEFTITVTAEGNQLMAQASGQAKFPVYPASPDLFFYKVVEARLRFNRNEKGEIVSLTLLQNRHELEGKKIN